MGSIVEDLMKQLTTGDTLSSLAKSAGTDATTTKSTLEMGLPLLMGAMNQSASKPEGLSTIMGIMSKMGTSNPVDDISKSLTSSSTSGGSDMMSSILGSLAPAILQSATKSTGSSSSVVSKIMSMVLPLLLGALTKKFTASTGADGLKKLLGEESEKALSSSTGAASILNAVTSKESAGIFGSVKKLFGM